MQLNENFHHMPVMQNEVIDWAVVSLLQQIQATHYAGHLYLCDATLGGCGHLDALFKKIEQTPELKNQHFHILGTDKDPSAVSQAQTRLNSWTALLPSVDIRIHHADFAEIPKLLTLNNWKLNFLFADFGVSSPQLDLQERGFSFRSTAQLDMRMNTEQSLTAQKILETYSQNQLQDIFFFFGEEPKSRKLAAAIVQDRKKQCLPLDCNGFSAYVARVLAYPPSHNHPATRTFQALRIAVNGELDSIEALLRPLPSLMVQQGSVIFLTFHSLEDRLVKNIFRYWCDKEAWRERSWIKNDRSVNFYRQNMFPMVELTPSIAGDKVNWKEDPKGGETASEGEISSNPRSRSARLRRFVFE